MTTTQENKVNEQEPKADTPTVATENNSVQVTQLHPGPKGEIGVLKSLAKVSQAIGAIGKDKKNDQQGFVYRSIDAVMSGIHDALAENEIVVTNRHAEKKSETRTTNRGGSIYYKEKEHTFSFRYIDGSRLDTTMTGSAMDTGDKADNKCLSIALKYALTTIFMIPLATDDPDGQSHDTANVAPEKKKDTGIAELKIYVASKLPKLEEGEDAKEIANQYVRSKLGDDSFDFEEIDDAKAKSILLALKSQK